MGKALSGELSCSCDRSCYLPSYNEGQLLREGNLHQEHQILPFISIPLAGRVSCLRFIGVGGFRILWGGGQGLEYWGGQGGPNSHQAHDVVLTSM